MEQVSGIEPPSQPWQGRILTAVLHLHDIIILSNYTLKCKEKLQNYLFYYIIMSEEVNYERKDYIIFSQTT